MSETSNGFHKYESACDDVWVYRLTHSYWDISKKVEGHTGKRLSIPHFRINPNINTKWGSWHPEGRVMEFASKLLRNFEWSAVEHVMKHEVAHQIVSEIFEMDCYGVAHGEAWKRACKIVDIEPKRCESYDFLSTYKGIEASPMVDRIRKIIIHANDQACTEEEASVFMRKAQELMIRNDLSMMDVTGTERVWLKRPVGLNYRRWPKWMGTLGTLLTDHYNVKTIQTYVTVDYKNHWRLELFGEPHNLDIAEYVAHAILNQAEYLYEEYKKEMAEKKRQNRIQEKQDGTYYKYGRSRISKRSFMEGLFRGYSRRLYDERKDTIAKIEAEDGAVVPTYDKGLMNEMYGKAYPGLRSVSGSYSRGQGYGAGESAGRSLRLSQGVSSGGNRGRLLST